MVIGILVRARAGRVCFPDLGVVGPRWAPRSSKSVAGRQRAAVGSTPIHSRLAVMEV